MNNSPEMPPEYQIKSDAIYVRATVFGSLAAADLVMFSIANVTENPPEWVNHTMLGAAGLFGGLSLLSAGVGAALYGSERGIHHLRQRYAARQE